MTKKIFSILLLAVVCFCALFSCRKTTVSTADATLNYFPLQLGKYITYNVDSIYYYSANCTQYEAKSQMKYAIDDTFTDQYKRLSYVMDVFTRPFDNNSGVWVHNSVILITPTITPPLTLSDPTTISLLYSQDQAQYVKLIFPISNGYSWYGNQYINTQNPLFTYLSNWNYYYKNFQLSYNTGYINFANTVTVLEDSEAVNYPAIDSNISSYLTYAEEVYADNVGMVHKQWTHWTYKPSPVICRDGYQVVMDAIDHN